MSCSYYEGEGLLTTAGCETVVVTDEYVDCAYEFSFISFPHSSYSPPFLYLVVTITPILVSSSHLVIAKTGLSGEFYLFPSSLHFG